MIDILNIIEDSKKDFTRDRSSVIGEFLKTHNNTVILSYIKKTRGDSIKFYYLKDGKKESSDYVVKNAKILIKSFLNNGVKLYNYNNGKIEEFKNDL